MADAVRHADGAVMAARDWVGPDRAPLLPPSLAEVINAGAEQLIRAQLAAAPPDGQAAVSKVASGKHFSDILADAADERAELIVLGMHREGGFKDSSTT